MNKHSPGPWRIWQNRIAPNVTETEIYDSENYKLANIARWKGESAEESEANARLIASAPDLLSALSEIVEHAEKYGAAPLSAVKMFDRARAAIEKVSA